VSHKQGESLAAYGWLRKQGIRNEGVHVLRHTFRSHLAMRGAPTRAIQELVSRNGRQCNEWRGPFVLLYKEARACERYVKWRPNSRTLS
jgi:hypothetical protein